VSLVVLRMNGILIIWMEWIKNHDAVDSEPLGSLDEITNGCKEHGKRGGNAYR